ncbi:MAG: hypothetical protein M1838_003655 [Thelocarpon superellum]|nr:MAG: hypothetical protein M1838_003655 [Thelocarpon superellum]
MHSTLVRVQNVFGLFTSIAFFVALLTALTSLAAPQAPKADLTVRSLQVVKGRPYNGSPKKVEFAHVRFDMDADFSSLFKYNTKQIFIYVTATWPSSNTTSSPTLDSAVIYDKILPCDPPFFPFGAISSTSRLFSRSNKRARPASLSLSDLLAPRPSGPGKLTLTNQKPKYPISDPSGRMAERTNVTLSVGWNVQPWVGALLWDGDAISTAMHSLGAALRLGEARRWVSLKGGRSAPFEFPPLKSAKPKE